MLARVGVGSTRRKKSAPRTHLLQYNNNPSATLLIINYPRLPSQPSEFEIFCCQILYEQLAVFAYEVWRVLVAPIAEAASEQKAAG